MNDEGKVGLVEPHAQRACRHQRLQFVIQKGLFQLRSAITCLACVRLDSQPAGLEPFRHLFGVADRQRVNDPASGKLREPLGQPGETFRLVLHPNRL